MTRMDGDWINITFKEKTKIQDLTNGFSKSELLICFNEPALNKFNVETPVGIYPSITHFEYMDKHKVIDYFKVGKTGMKSGRNSALDEYAQFLLESDFEKALVTEIYVNRHGSYELEISTIKFVKDGELFGIAETSIKEFQDDEFLRAIDRDFVDTFLGIQILFHYSDEIRSYRQYKKAIKSKVIRGEMYRQPGKVFVYQLPKVTDELEEKVRKHIEVIVRHCEAWGVRGHYRHYKNGTVVYIKPYVKGTNKSAYKGREYVLFKEENKCR